MLHKTDRAPREPVETKLQGLRWMYSFPLPHSPALEVRIDVYETTEYAFGELIIIKDGRLAGDVGNVRPPRSYEKKWMWYAHPPGGRGPQTHGRAVDFETVLDDWTDEVLKIMDSVATRKT